MNTKILTLAITLLFCFSCSQSKSKQVEVNTDTTAVFFQSQSQSETISQKMTDEEVEAALKAIVENSDDKSLNEIRFRNWTEKDWYDNDYFRFLRKCIDDYIKGIENEDTRQLKDYKSVLKDKFFIYNAEPYIGGGLFITLGFLNKLEIMYQAVVYSDVDKDTGKITAYRLRGFIELEETSDITKEDIFQIIKEHPENKLW
jgi:hypothetical protein